MKQSKEINDDNNILRLLPHSPETLLNDQSKKFQMLLIFKFLVEEINETMFLFCSKKMDKFDPHVGDTLCQIRAYKICLLSCKSFGELGIELRRIQYSIEQCINEFDALMKNKNGKHCRELDKSETICSFLERKGLIFKMPEDFIFLIQSKMLSDFSKVDEEGISRGIDYDKFSLKASITKSLSKRIMHYYQQSLSRLSCQFITDLVRDLPELKILAFHLNSFLKIDKDGRAVLPCYEVTKVLLKHILKNKRPILFSIERRCSKEKDSLNLLFFPNENRDEFTLVDSSDSVYPCIIVKGITEYKCQNLIETRGQFIKRLTKLGIYNVIMANMACHPQYSASELQDLNNDPYSGLLAQDEPNSQRDSILELKNEFLKMKEMGQQSGCYIGNASLFLVRHIFCDMANYCIEYSEQTTSIA